MQDTVTTWDLRNMPHEASSYQKLFVLFFLVAGIVALIKLIRIWRDAPPFRLTRQNGNPFLVPDLQTNIRSLASWMRLTALICVFIACSDFYRGSTAFDVSRKVFLVDFIHLLRDLSQTIGMGVTLLLWQFLIRWHFVKRVEKLDKIVASHAS